MDPSPTHRECSGYGVGPGVGSGDGLVEGAAVRPGAGGPEGSGVGGADGATLILGDSSVGCVAGVEASVRP